MDKYTVILLLGIVFTVFGGLTVFSKPFFDGMRRTLWKPTKSDEAILSPSGVKDYAKFQGFMGLLVGIFLLALWLFR